MDWSKIVEGLQGLVAIVEEVAPAASALGPQGAAAGKIVSAAAALAGHILDHAADDQTVISSGDLAVIQAAVARISAENDALAARIDAS